VCVILRHHGGVIGVGTASVGSSNPVAESARNAFKEVSDNNIVRRLDPELRKFAMATVSIELELGAKPEPSPSKNLDRISQSINKGIDGVAVRKRGKWALRLPAELRLAPNQNTAITLESLCIEVGVHPATALSRHLSPSDDVTLYTFPTITIVQDSIGEPIRRLVRGDEIVDAIEITMTTINHTADLIATHLITCTNDAGLVVGGYQPETDSLAPPHATVFVQILVATALDAYLSNEFAANKDDAMAATANILAYISNRFADDSIIADSVAAAIVILGNSNNQLQKNMHTLYDRCEQQVLDVCHQLVHENNVTKKPHVISMLADAAASIAVNGKDPTVNELAQKMCATCIRTIPLESQIATIPWLVDAVSKVFDQGLQKSSMQQLLSLAISSQINEEGDLFGGFSLVSGDSTVTDARGVRMLPMLALFAQLPNPSQSKAIPALKNSLRFVMQLTTRSQRASRFSNPTLSKGGVRAATWDASMPTEVSAMALLGVSRAIKAFKVASGAR
jgi:hypothetical protein